MIRYAELNLYRFSGVERNRCTHGHSPFADVHALAANFGHVSSHDGDWARDGTPKVAPPFSQYQSVSRLESVAN